MAQIKISEQNSAKPVEISASELLSRAIQERDKLNIFIRMLINSIHGRELSCTESEQK